MPLFLQLGKLSKIVIFVIIKIFEIFNEKQELYLLNSKIYYHSIDHKDFVFRSNVKYTTNIISGTCVAQR